MNKIQESLKANESEILAALPQEFQEDFKKQLANPVPQVAPLSGAAEVEAIKAELASNPAVNETEAAAELTDLKVPVKESIAIDPQVVAAAAAKSGL